MGVSIYGYVTKSRSQCDTDRGQWCENEEHRPLYNLAGFEDRAGLEVIETTGELVRYGCFALGEQREIMHATYSGYNRWRAQLCRAALGIDPDAVWESGDRSLAFYDLIDFPDNEGVLGGPALESILLAFETHGDRLTAAGVEHVEAWRRALREVVAGNGVVVYR